MGSINVRNKDVNRVIRYAEQHGFEVTRNKHIKLKKYNETIVIAGSPSCCYGPENALKQVKKLLEQHGDLNE